MERRKEILRVDEPEHMTIAQLKLKLREARVSERDIALCIERSQLNTLYMERLDTEFKSAVLVQRHWRSLQEWRKTRATRERMQRQGALDGAEEGEGAGTGLQLEDRAYRHALRETGRVLSSLSRFGLRPVLETRTRYR